ncbi:hypothetical protein BDW74DRAFT_183100 [Aspergillus multicolor]|uniref:uncharacterized protein n=1 Tax=Aspergillus multicolor TaxID=41759 RepID=UPI003CCE32B1
MTLPTRPKRATSSAAGLATYPADILYMIFPLLDIAEYRALSLTNVHLHAFVEPFLYFSIHMVWEQTNFPSPLAALIWTLLSRPSLAAHITELCLEGRGLFRAFQMARAVIISKIPVPFALVNSARLFIEWTGLSYAKTWIEELSAPGHWICHRVPDFRHLRDVLFQLEPNHSGVPDRNIKNTLDVLPLFYLPSIQRIVAGIENPSSWTWPARHRPSVPNLTSLELFSIREKYLGDLLSSTSNVQFFRYYWFYDRGLQKYRDEFTTDTVHLDQLVAAIARIRETLTDLVLDAELDPAYYDVVHPGVKVSGSLQELTSCASIKTLQIPFVFLVGFGRDPSKRLYSVMLPNVESVVITDDLALQNDECFFAGIPPWGWEEHTIIGVVKKWLDEMKAGICTPRLRRIALRLEFAGTNEWKPKTQRKFRRMGARYGVELDVLDLDAMEYPHITWPDSGDDEDIDEL